LNILKYLKVTGNSIWQISVSGAGTSIGANIREAQSAESRNDFIHKLKISDKEAEETEFRLQLCRQSKNYPECSHLIVELISLKRILGKTISSTKNRS
jgi:four helix bundle protein